MTKREIHEPRRPRGPARTTRALLAFAALLALAPFAAAQDVPQENDTDGSQEPAGEGAPGPQESIEDAHGATYGLAVLAGTAVAIGLLAVLSHRYRQRRGSRPPP